MSFISDYRALHRGTTTKPKQTRGRLRSSNNGATLIRKAQQLERELARANAKIRSQEEQLKCFTVCGVQYRYVPVQYSTVKPVLYAVPVQVHTVPGFCETVVW